MAHDVMSLPLKGEMVGEDERVGEVVAEGVGEDELADGHSAALVSVHEPPHHVQRESGAQSADVE